MRVAMHPNQSSGYSLLELLVVLGIMSLILLIATPTLSNTVDRFTLASDARTVVSQLKALRERAMDLQKEISVSAVTADSNSLATSENETYTYSSGIVVLINNRTEPQVLRISWDGSMAGQLILSNGFKKIRVFARDLNGPITLEPMP